MANTSGTAPKTELEVAYQRFKEMFLTTIRL